MRYKYHKPNLTRNLVEIYRQAMDNYILYYLCCKNFGSGKRGMSMDNCFINDFFFFFF